MATKEDGLANKLTTEQSDNMDDVWVYPFAGGPTGAAFEIPNVVQVIGSPQSTIVERDDSRDVARVASFDCADVTVTMSGPTGNMLAAMFAGESIEDVTDIVRQGFGDESAEQFEAFARAAEETGDKPDA